MIPAVVNASGIREDMVAAGGKVDKFPPQLYFVSYSKDFILFFYDISNNFSLENLLLASYISTTNVYKENI